MPTAEDVVETKFGLTSLYFERLLVQREVGQVVLDESHRLNGITVVGTTRAIILYYVLSLAINEGTEMRPGS